MRKRKKGRKERAAWSEFNAGLAKWSLILDQRKREREGGRD